MEEKSSKKQLSDIFPDRQNTDTSANSYHAENAAQFYAVSSKGETNRSFDLILRSGDEYTVPYALIPIYQLTGNTQIKILTYDLNITIKGRGNLRRIRDYLKQETITWIKESPSGKDDGLTDIFISNIEIQGKAIDE